MQDIKRKITDIAIEAFRQEGYDNISVNEICRLSGIAKKTFYYHFESKDEILFNTYAEYDTDMSEIAIRLMMLPNYTERLWYLFNLAIEKTEKLGLDISTNLIKSSLTRKKSLILPIQKEYGDNSSQGAKLMMEVIIQGQQSGEFRNNADPEQLHWSFTSALLGATVTWCASDGAIDRNIHLRKLFEHIFLNN